MAAEDFSLSKNSFVLQQYAQTALIMALFQNENRKIVSALPTRSLFQSVGSMTLLPSKIPLATSHVSFEEKCIVRWMTRDKLIKIYSPGQKFGLEQC